MGKEHKYRARVVLTGDRCFRTRDYRAYLRDHGVWSDEVGARLGTPGSPDPGLRGDGSR